jgi:integration host factor subunit beta
LTHLPYPPLPESLLRVEETIPIFENIYSHLQRKSGIPSIISDKLDSQGMPQGDNTMTKADLVDKVSSLGDLTRRDGEIIVDTLFESVIGALKADDKVEIRGFGSFRTRQRNSRIGRNPKTGERVDVPAKRVPYFKPSKELRDSVNPGGGKSQLLAKKSVSTSPVDPHHPPAM